MYDYDDNRFMTELGRMIRNKVYPFVPNNTTVYITDDDRTTIEIKLSNFEDPIRLERQFSIQETLDAARVAIDEWYDRLPYIQPDDTFGLGEN